VIVVEQDGMKVRGRGAEPLDMKIVNKDILEIFSLARGRTPTTTRLRRVK